MVQQSEHLNCPKSKGLLNPGLQPEAEGATERLQWDNLEAAPCQQEPCCQFRTSFSKPMPWGEQAHGAPVLLLSPLPGLRHPLGHNTLLQRPLILAEEG